MSTNVKKDTVTKQVSQETVEDMRKKADNLISQMKQKGIKAHPYVFVSVIHNNDPVIEINRSDDFFVNNNIEFIDLPSLNCEIDETNTTEFVCDAKMTGRFTKNKVKSAV